MLLSKLFQICSNNEGWQTINDVDYKFIEQDNTLQIFFMGSYQISDWLRNFWFFNIPKKPYKDMDITYRVHRGFLSAWKQVEDIIIAKITELNNRNNFKWKHITVVGYSHGGALAAFCHECIWFWRPDLRDGGFEGYGFEAPRIYAGYRVKPELRERWETFHVVRDGSDIVTHCPPKIFGYCHVGDIIKIRGDSSLVNKWYMPKCIKSHFPQVVYDGLIKYENQETLDKATERKKNKRCFLSGK